MVGLICNEGEGAVGRDGDAVGEAEARRSTFPVAKPCVSGAGERGHEAGLRCYAATVDQLEARPALLGFYFVDTNEYGVRNGTLDLKVRAALPNVDAVLRRLQVLKKGVVVEKYFSGEGIAKGKLIKKEKVQSTLYPGEERDAGTVRYDADGFEEDFEEEELRSGKDGPAPANGDGKPVLVVRDLPERNAICDSLAPGFAYLEARITGTCETQYSCVKMYDICRLAQAFDPNFANDQLTPAFVDTLQAITPLAAHGLLTALKRELPQYLAAAAQAPVFGRSDVGDYSEAILKWWRVHSHAFPSWARAARIVFALSPNSASCERVFSLLKVLFGEQQMSALGDQIRAALMLRHNGRRVG